MAGEFGFGTKLKVTLASTLTDIASLTSINGPEQSADDVEISAHDSADGYREFTQGLKDGGTVEIEGNYRSETSQVALEELFASGDTVAMEIVYPSSIAKKHTFSGYVSGIGKEAPYDDKLSFSASIKITGKPLLVDVVV